MTKIKKAILLVLLLISVTALCLSFGVETSNEKTVQAKSSVSGEKAIEPQGIYTKMSFSLDGGDGQVWFRAKNQFTLFSSTVTVYVELYRSDTYQENYEDMTLAASNYIYDLDQGESIKAISSTEGKQSYWKGRCYYKRDSSGWNEVVSDTILFNGNGVGITK